MQITRDTSTHPAAASRMHRGRPRAFIGGVIASLVLAAGTATAADPGSLWTDARAGKQIQVDRIAEAAPAVVIDGNEPIALEENLAERERRRDARVDYVRKQLERMLLVVNGEPVPEELMVIEPPVFDEPGEAGEQDAADEIAGDQDAEEQAEPERFEPPTVPEVAMSEALVYAVELSMLLRDREQFLQDPSIGKLVAEAEAMALAAENAGKWLYANELYYRLSVLFFDEGRYREESRRQSTRLAMLRLYAPEHLYGLRNERRQDSGLEPLPDFNPTGSTWPERLDGISKHMVMRAVNRSAELHVERVSMSDILRSGLENVATFASTPDLVVAFDGIGNDAKRSAFLSEVENEIRRVNESVGPLGYVELNAILTRLTRASDRTIGAPTEAIYHEFGNGAMSALDDFSAIIWPDELRQFTRSTSGAFVGVGIQIQLDELYNIRVVTPLEGMPAQRAGIRTDDLIKAVNGETTAGFTSDQAVQVITGPENTAVTLTIEREENGETVQKDIRIVRARIKLPSIRGWRKTDAGNDPSAWDWFVDEDKGIGYIRMSQFVDETSKDFDAAVAAMKAQGLNGLVLDLRYNPGGLLDQAVEISNRFIESGEIVRTEDGNGILRDAENARPGKATLSDIPTVVLINENSASASEIVSGAIQDYAHAGKVDALLVGDRSFGKGSVQNVWMLHGNKAAMKLTTQYYKLPGGRLIHRTPGDSSWGVEPDINVEMLPSQQLQAYALRQNADILPIDENGNVIADADRPDPDRLIDEAIDLQLQTAVVLLQDKIKSESVLQAQLNKDGAGNDIP